MREFPGPERRKHGGQVNLGEIINEQIGGCGAAIHDDQIRLCEGGKNVIEIAPVAQIEKPGIGVKPFQRRILVVTVKCDMDDALVFQELDKIDGEEAFADAAFAVKDENQSFHCLPG